MPAACANAHLPCTIDTPNPPSARIWQDFRARGVWGGVVADGRRSGGHGGAGAKRQQASASSRKRCWGALLSAQRSPREGLGAGDCGNSAVIRFLLTWAARAIRLERLRSRLNSRMTIEVGESFTERAGGVHHTYTLLGKAPHVAQSGRATELWLWGGTCVVCGVSFQALTGRAWRGRLPRACKAHRPWLVFGVGTEARASWTRTLRRRRLAGGSSRVVKQPCG